MTCPACECDVCAEAHPATDEMVELEEIEFQAKRLRALWRDTYGREPNPEELFDPAAIVFTLSAAMIKVNGLNMGLNAGLYRLIDLLGEES